MPVRRPSLEEWFLAYQLRRLARTHFFSPFSFEADVTALIAGYRSRGERPPLSALLVKAVALAGRAVPEANVAYFTRPWGDRVAVFSEATVNMPIVVEAEGRSHVGALSFRRADERTVEELQAELRAAKERGLRSTPLTRWVARSPNTFLHRLALRLLHFVVFVSPALYERKGGGGLAVSVLHNKDPGLPRFRALSCGPGAVTAFSSGFVETPEGRTLLPVTLGFDHCALPGHVMQRFVNALHHILTEASSFLACGKEEEPE